MRLILSYMKKCKYLLIAFLIGLFFINCGTQTEISLKDFSVSPPKGWTTEKESETSVVFHMPNQKADEVYISVGSSEMENLQPLEKTWELIKPYLVENKTVLVEDSTYFSNTKWMRLVYLEKMKIGDHKEEFKAILLFTTKANKRFRIQFFCPNNKFDETSPIFEKVRSSFIFR